MRNFISFILSRCSHETGFKTKKEKKKKKNVKYKEHVLGGIVSGLIMFFLVIG